MEKLNCVRKMAREEIDERKQEIINLETRIAELETEQQAIEEETALMLEWIERLRNQQEQLQQQCEELESEIEEKRLPGSFSEKLNVMIQKLKNAIKLNKQEEKGLKVTLTKQEKKELASELVGQSNIGVDLKPLVQEAINSEE